MKVHNNHYCVYTHDINRVIFYVGKGKCYRPFITSCRSSDWEDHVEKNGGEYNVEIVEWFQNEQDAYEFERSLIIKHKPKCNLQGTKIISFANQNKPKPKDNLLLQKAIINSGLSVQEWAESIGLSHVTIYNALDGKYSVKTAVAIYKHTDKTVKLPIKRINPYSQPPKKRNLL